MNTTFFEVRKPTNEKPALQPEQVAKMLRMASPPGLKTEKRNAQPVQQSKESRNRNSMGMSFDSDSDSENSGSRSAREKQQQSKTKEDVRPGFSSLIKREFFNRDAPKRPKMDMLKETSPEQN